jgi:tripartite-type tricarboxylate transporter receptor subunit TctC
MLPGFDFSSWWGIVGPRGMPQDIISTLNAAVNKLLASAELSQLLANEGAEAESMTPEQFGTLMRLETQRWITVAREAKISID